MKLPESVNELKRKLDDLLSQSTLFYDTWVKRKLILTECSSGQAGLGTTFLRDLEILFRERFKETDLFYGISLGEINSNAKKSDYVLDKCNVASFAVDKAESDEDLELITRAGEVTEEDNPEYLDRVKKKKVTTGVPPKLISQKIYKYTKHISRVNVVVHARLTFTLLHQGKEDFFEVNKFMKKEFVIETIDPRETIVKTEKVVGPEEPEPVLRNDNVWVASEMKDWARMESQNLLVLNVMRYIADYSNWIAEFASSFEQKQQWQVAGNFWGFCLEYCKRIKPDPELIKAQLEDKEILDHTREELEISLKSVKELAKLKASVWDSAVNALISYLEPSK